MAAVYAMQPDTRIDRVIQDANLHYLHFTFAQGDGLPEHPANAHVYMTVLAGTLTIALDGGPDAAYTRGTVLAIPRGTRMHPRNLHPEPLELTVVKAPAPAL